MAGAITGYLLYQLLPREYPELRRPLSVLSLFLICVAAAVAAALTGGGAARLLFGRDFLTGIEFWFVTELVNSLIILPVILTFRGWSSIGYFRRHNAKSTGERLNLRGPPSPLLSQQ
jgi:hypothetical protein